MSVTELPALDPVVHCANCPPKPQVLPLDSWIHPGFGGLVLEIDGEVPEFWREFCNWPVEDEYYYGEWETGTRDDGSTYEWFTGDFQYRRLEQELRLSDIEACATEDPDHDWRITMDGPFSSLTYQRQQAGWVLVGREDGFA